MSTELALFTEQLTTFTKWLHRLVPQDVQIRKLYTNVRMSRQFGATMERYACTLFLTKMRPFTHRVRACDAAVFTDNPSSFLDTRTPRPSHSSRS